MDKLEINRDTARINKEIEQCNRLKNHAQLVFAEFKKLNITLSVKDLCDIIHIYPSTGYMANKSAGESFVVERVKDLLIQHPDVYKIEGIEIDKERLKDMVKLPNISGLLSSLNSINYDDRVFAMFLDITDKVVLISDYQEKITAMYVQYAHGENQISIAQKLIKLKDELNSYIEFIGFRSWLKEEIPGLIYDADYKFKIDIHFIQSRS